MKKRLLLRAAAIVLAAAMLTGIEKSAAQSRVQFGVRAGLTSQDLKLEKSDFKDASFATDTKFGYHVALASRIRIVGIGGRAAGVGLFLQPEVVYTSSKFKIQKNDVKDEPTSTTLLQSIEVPVLVSLKVSIVRIQAGPVFYPMYKNTLKSGNIDIKPTKHPSVGYAAGLSVDLVGGLVLDGRFGGQFRKFHTNVKMGETIYDSVRSSLSSWSVGLSWMF